MAKSTALTKNAPTNESAELATEAPDAAHYIRPITKADMRGVSIERIGTLDAGTMLEGVYRGVGATIEVTDPVTGEVRDLVTHRFEVTPDVVIRLMDSYQLRRDLPQYEGKKVRVMKLGQVNTRKGARVNDFIVAEVR